MISLQGLKERKLVQWGLAYLAGAWLLLQVLGLLAQPFAWPALVLRSTTVLLGVGFFGVLVLAWYHGEQGRQRASGVELLMLTGILLVAGVAVASVSRPGAPSTPEDAALGSAFTASAPVAEQGSIAVLPFVNMSGDEDYFSDGLTEELLNVLAQLPELRVAARTSAFRFKGSKAPIDSIGRALNVAHVLEGSVRKSGDQVRITAQLIDAGNGFHLWSATYDRDLSDIFAVQDEISRAIVQQLQLKLGGGRAGAPLAKQETSDSEAHTLVLKAVQVVRQGTEEAHRQAEALLTEALRRDPEYARAHAQLAILHEVRTYHGYLPREQGLARARSAAERALALDPTEARAHQVLGMLASDYDWDWSVADAHYARAIQLNPGLAGAYGQRAWMLMRLGSTEEALRLAERAVELDPVAQDVYNNLGAMYTFAGRMEEGVEKFQEAIQLAPGNPVLLGNLALNAAILNRHEEAIRAGERAVEAAHDNPFALTTLAYAYARAGNKARAEQVLAQLRALPEVPPYLLATVWAGLGDSERVLRLLEQAVEERDTHVPDLGVDPVFRAFRGEPRVQRLLENMGLPAARS